MLCMCFFFFNQKTAYEMRISDWSSDVCSSDLRKFGTPGYVTVPMMSGSMTAAFVLGINMSLAGIFAVAFAVVAATNRTARGAWWLAFGYGMGIVYVALAFLLTRQVDPTPVGIGIFLVFLLEVSFALVGVDRKGVG